MAKLTALVPLIDSVTFKQHAKGETFESSDSALLENGLAVLAEAESEVNSEVEKGSSSEEAPEWNKKISPTEYLEKYPNGPAAELARRILAAEAGASTSEES
jgi:hypothetical protein